MSASTYRLPSHASPRRYDVALDARLGREAFTGRVAIALDLHESKDSLDLHARDLELSNAVLHAEGQELPAEVTLDPENERAVLRFSRTFPTGPGTLTLDFSGVVSQSLKGLYLAQDRPDQVLCTQCEATDARAIFPCFDEPTFKARFAFEITTAADAAVLANGPLVSVEEAGDSRIWKFAATKTMSSYLVAFIIGDMAGTEERVVNGIPLRVWTMRGKEQHGAFALDYTARLLPWYEDYFGAAYFFDKYDQAAVPGFAAGAMENSGLVIFRQEALILGQGSASWRQEKGIAHVIAHEFAHMWFGNLVTMAWWDDLWLNEAFAEWISYRAVSDLSPNYRMWDDFQGSKTYALATDSLESTHPIYSPVETPAQAQELFDVITYIKGCAVLRMLENFLGQDPFRAGLRTYMDEFAERNALGADLWRHLQEASSQPVTQIMESWILQSGFPLVTAALETADGTAQLHLRQERFFSNPQAARDGGQHWLVPLVIRYADEAGVHELRRLLSGPDETVVLPVSGELHWCIANADEVGFYRQDLTGELLAKALAHLDQLTASEQIGLLADQWALVRSGNRPISQFLDAAEALAASDDYNLLSELVGHLRTLEQVVEDLGDEAVMSRFRAWVQRLFKGKLAALGYEPRQGESTEISQQRGWAIQAMTVLAHDPEAIAEARRWATLEAAEPQSVDPNLAGAFVSAGARFGDGELFAKHVAVYQDRKNSGAPPQLVNRYLYSFATFRPTELVTQVLSLLDEGIAPKEAMGPLLRQMLAARHSQLAAWDYTKANWPALKDQGFGAGELIKAAGNLPYGMRADFVAFCEAQVKGVADMAYAQGLENMDQQAEFRTRINADLVKWLNGDGS